MAPQIKANLVKGIAKALVEELAVPLMDTLDGSCSGSFFPTYHA